MADDDVKQLLIELVRERPVLYSKADKNFKDARTIKKNNWGDIARELAEQFPDQCGTITGEEAAKLWTNIRDTFMANKRSYEVRCASGSPAVAEPPWKFWPFLKWLLDYNKKLVSCSNVAAPTNNLPPPPLPTTTSTSSALHQPCSPPSRQPSTSSSQPSSGPSTPCASADQIIDLEGPRPKKGKLPKKRNLPTLDLDKEISVLKSSILQDDAEDEMGLYGRSLAAKMRKLTTYQAAVARRDIEDVLFNVQYKCPPHPPMCQAPPGPLHMPYGGGYPLPPPPAITTTDTSSNSVRNDELLDQ